MFWYREIAHGNFESVQGGGAGDSRSRAVPCLQSFTIFRIKGVT